MSQFLKINSFTLTHWGRVTHICVVKLTIIGSDNGLSPGWRQAIIWTNAGILLIGPLWTNFREILIEIPTFSFTKMRLKVSSAKWRPFCLGLNVLITSHYPCFNQYFRQNKMSRNGWHFWRHYQFSSWWRHQMETFSITGPLCGEFTSHRWIPLTKASDAELWCLFWYAPE